MNFPGGGEYFILNFTLLIPAKDNDNYDFQTQKCLTISLTLYFYVF